MKFSTGIKTAALACFLSVLLSACSTETRQEASSEFEQFSTWVDQNAERAETATEEEWDEMQAEYTRRSTELETKSADWDDKTKAEWEELKMRWSETEGKAETRFRDADAAVEGDTL
jgi:Skp family chaperone for outer membrane proteins